MLHNNIAVKLVYIIFKKFYKICTCSKLKYGTQRQNYVVLVAIIIVASATYMLTREKQKLKLNDTVRLVEDRLKEYYLEEKGVNCEFPKLNPFSAEAMEYVMELPKITCDGHDWVICNKSVCYVKEEVLKKITDITCTYQDIVYVNDDLYFLSGISKVIGSAKYTLNKSDHVKVTCAGRSSKRWSGVKAGFRQVTPEPIPSNRQDSYNVIFLVFDSASHNGFIRKMPNSFKYIADRAVILNGLNIIGDGTLAALYPIFTGKTENENLDARINITNKIYVDHKSFIIHQLKKYGYRTAYFEGSPDIATFSYRCNGFLQQPADHYLQPLLLENKNKFINMIKINSKFCVGDTPQYQLLLDLTNEFLQLDGKKFGFTFLVDISHDNFNQISTADEAVVSFLETLAERQVFEDTLVILMGDHGTRFASAHESHQENLEERLPLVAIFLPEKLKQLRPHALQALERNKYVLTTFLDVHATLLDVLDLKELSNNYKVPGSDLPRAMSLLEPIPKTRICAEAGIIQHWCVCLQWFDVPKDEPMFDKAGGVLAKYIHNISEEQRSKCAQRKLISTISVLKHNVNTFLGKSAAAAPRPHKEYYQAKIIMGPGRGVFEATMSYNTHKDSFTINLNDISRITPYANESKCIAATHPHLNPFCYCKDLPPKENATSINEV